MVSPSLFYKLKNRLIELTKLGINRRSLKSFLEKLGEVLNIIVNFANNL